MHYWTGNGPMKMRPKRYPQRERSRRRSVSWQMVFRTAFQGSDMSGSSVPVA